MTLGEAIAQLRHENYPIAPYQVHYLLRCGKIRQPKKDGAGNYQFEREDLDQIRSLIKERRSGRLDIEV